MAPSEDLRFKIERFDEAQKLGLVVVFESHPPPILFSILWANFTSWRVPLIFRSKGLNWFLGEGGRVIQSTHSSRLSIIINQLVDIIVNFSLISRFHGWWLVMDFLLLFMVLDEKSVKITWLRCPCSRPSILRLEEQYLGFWTTLDHHIASQPSSPHDTIYFFWRERVGGDNEKKRGGNRCFTPTRVWVRWPYHIQESLCY